MMDVAFTQQISALSLWQLSLLTATDVDPRLPPFASRSGFGGGEIDRTCSAEGVFLQNVPRSANIPIILPARSEAPPIFQ